MFLRDRSNERAKNSQSICQQQYANAEYTVVYENAVMCKKSLF